MAQATLAQIYFDELSEANKRIFELRTTVAELNSRLPTNEEKPSKDAADKRAERAQSDIHDLERKHAKEKAEWQKETAALERQISALVKVRDEALHRQTQLQEETAAHEDLLKEAEKTEEDLRSQLQEATTRHEKQDKRSKTLTEQLAAEQREVARLKGVLQASGKTEDDDAGTMEVRDEQRYALL